MSTDVSLAANASRAACDAAAERNLCSTSTAGIASLFIVPYCALFLVCFASFRFAGFVSQKTGWLPRGSGFLAVGLLAGVLKMVKNTDCVVTVLTNTDTFASVYFPLNYVSMAFIAYATGSEINAERYRKLFKRMLLGTLSISLSVFLFVGVACFLFFSYGQVQAPVA